MALATLAEVKQWLGMSVTTDDTLLTALIDRVSTGMQTHISRVLEAGEFTEISNGSGKASLAVKNPPIREVVSLLISGKVVVASVSADKSGYVSSDNFLYLRGDLCFTKGLQNIELTYWGGYEDIPSDIIQEVCRMVGFTYRQKTRIGESSKVLGGETVSYQLSMWTKETLAVLDRYKRVIY